MPRPEGFDITQNELYYDMDQLKEYYESVGRGGTRLLIVSSPPGVGKTYLAHKHLPQQHERTGKVSSYKLVNANSIQLLDELRANRTDGQILVFDDADRVLRTTNSLNLLKMATQTKPPRTIPDSRKDRKPFDFEGAIVILTNINMANVAGEFPSRLITDVNALCSRAVIMPMSFKDIEAYHYACWLVVEGARDQTRLELRMNRDTVNEVLRWYSEYYTYMKYVSPRSLNMLLEMRRALRKATVWEKAALVHCHPEPQRGNTLPPVWSL